jgi:spore germination protein
VGVGNLATAPPLPSLLLDGVPVRPGDTGIPPQPRFTLALPAGFSASDYTVLLDEKALPLETAAPQHPSLVLPSLAQGSSHRLRVTLVGRLLRPGRSVLEVGFSVVNPLAVYAAWIGGPDVVLTVGASRPLTDAAPLEKALRAAGATVRRSETHVSGTWTRPIVGRPLAVTIPAGLVGEGGAFLESPFTSTYLAPATPGARVDLSNQRPVSTAGLKLQVYYVPTEASRLDLSQHANRIDILSPQFYSVTGDGSLTSTVDAAVLRIASAAAVRVEPLVINRDFDRDEGHRVLANPAHAGRVADQLVAEAHRLGYSGYQLDFEGLLPTDRDLLSGFSQVLGSRLRAAGLHYSAAVIPRKGAGAGTIGGFVQAVAGMYDYPVLARGTDWLSLMAYEQHTRNTGPGPVAALDWVRQVTEGTGQGLDRARVYLGIPFYHRDWRLSGSPTAGGFADAIGTAAMNRSELTWDFTAATASFRYSDETGEHSVWIEEARSLAAKIEVARDRGLAGVSAWRLGLEDPAFGDDWPAR